MTETREHRGAIARAVAPLFVVNALAVYGQLAYAYEDVSPASWPIVARVMLAVGFAAATESVALYVGWHAHDALLLRSHSTARSLRRWSFLIALIVGAMNYSHFTADPLRPTAAAIAFGLLSLLSPWMWGLHSRRAARIQLLKERRVDDAGAEFSTARKRAFPIRSMKAYRWSIDHNVTDPRDAWDGYHGRMPVLEPVQPVIASTSVQPVRIASRPSNKTAAWDVELAVKMILDGRTDEVMAVTGVGAKPLQLLRRAMRFLGEGLSEVDTAARVPCSLAHVQRVKAAMA